MDRAELLADAKQWNDIKGILLLLATIAQVAAVTTVAGGVIEVLAAAPVSE